jgi:hypothetical protein
MFFAATRVLAIILMAIPLASYSTGAQMPNPSNSDRRMDSVAPSNGTTRLTAKERLGEKWNDEQRVDNCKVPPEKRGTKPRPNDCAHPPKY